MKLDKYTILHIDDKKDHHDTIKNAALRAGIELVYKKNLDEGYKALVQNDKYRAVILDGMAQISDGDKIDYAFVSEARVKMEQYVAEKGIYLPYVFYTGFKPSVDALVKNIPVIEKSADPKVLFEKLLELIEASKEEQIRKEHFDVFKIFKDDYLPSTDERHLIQLILEYKNPLKMVSSITLTRRLLESVIKAMIKLKCIFDNSILLTKKGTKRKYNFKVFHDFLIGIDEVTGSCRCPEYITKQMWFIHKVSSMYGNHTPESLYPITKYTVKVMVFSLLDILLWFKHQINN